MATRTSRSSSGAPRRAAQAQRASGPVGTAPATPSARRGAPRVDPRLIEEPRGATGPVPVRADRAVDDEEAPPPGPPRWVPWLSLVLCVLATADAGYLTYDHYHPGALVCSTTGLIDCQKVITSPQSMVFGVPVAIIGLAFYVVMTAVCLPPLWRVANVWLARLRLAMVVGGMGMVINLVVAELFIIKNICEYCTGVHVLTFALFVTVVLTYPAVSYRARWLAWRRAGSPD